MGKELVISMIVTFILGVVILLTVYTLVWIAMYNPIRVKEDRKGEKKLAVMANVVSFITTIGLIVSVIYPHFGVFVKKSDEVGFLSTYGNGFLVLFAIIPTLLIPLVSRIWYHIMSFLFPIFSEVLKTHNKK